jgi:hypothetical protein
VTERSEGTGKHSPPGHSADAGGHMTERSEGTKKHSPLVFTPPTEEGT